MASESEARQLAQLDPQYGPKSPEIGARKGFMAMMTGTTHPGHKVPLHVMSEAMLMAEAVKNRKKS